MKKNTKKNPTTTEPTENAATQCGWTKELLAMLQDYRVQSYVKITKSKGLKRLNIHLVEKQPALTLGVA